MNYLHESQGRTQSKTMKNPELLWWTWKVHHQGDQSLKQTIMLPWQRQASQIKKAAWNQHTVAHSILVDT